jgi:nicotinamide-nucleotide amidase
MAEDVRGEALARAARDRDLTIAVAESLTGGALASRLARLPDAGTWFRGSIVAYASSVKHAVLGVPDVPVVSEPSARAMAEGARQLFDADVTIAVTGEGGPEPQDDVPVGTVWMAVAKRDGTQARHLLLDGDPADIVEGTCDAAVDWLADHVVSRAPTR